MGKKLGKYYEDLAGRIEDLRKEKGFSQEDMAYIMEVELKQYKRYMYNTALIPAERVALLINKLRIDPLYILTGRTTKEYECISILETANEEKVADMLDTLADVYRARVSMRGKSKEKVDYTAKDGTLIETETVKGRKKKGK